MFNKSINFMRRFIRGNYYFLNQSLVSKGMEVMKNTKFQLNISKIMIARPKKHRDNGDYNKVC